jgi:hypothetical protein
VAIPTLSPSTLAELQAFFSSLQAATPAVTPPTSGMPTQMAAFWASPYAGKGQAVRQLRNGKWVDSKGAICKAPAATPSRKPAAVTPAKSAFELSVDRGVAQQERAEAIALHYADRGNGMPYAVAFELCRREVGKKRAAAILA